MARPQSAADPFVPARHDHRQCIDDAARAADGLCRQRGARLTALRKRVLELVWQGHRPVGAYEILEQLRRDGRRAAPPTVYRALDFLHGHGLVHRIDCLNAYIGCIDPGAHHRAHFLICDACGRAAEIEDRGLRGALDRCAAAAAFEVRSETVELRGVCADCRA